MPRWEPDTRTRLVESALELFEAQGYDATTVADIAARAGVTKTTFFRQFPEKREVLAAGQEAHCDLLAAAIAAAPAGAAPREAILAGLEAVAATFPPDHHAFAARLRAVTDRHPDLQEREGVKHAGYLIAIRDALRARSVPEPTATVAADLGVLAFKLAFARWVDGDPDAPFKDVVRATLDEVVAAGAHV